MVDGAIHMVHVWGSPMVSFVDDAAATAAAAIFFVGISCAAGVDDAAATAHQEALNPQRSLAVSRTDLFLDAPIVRGGQESLQGQGKLQVQGKNDGVLFRHGQGCAESEDIGERRAGRAR